MADETDAFLKVDEEIGQGRLWRPKVILLGRVASADYDPILFHKIGEVLAAMRDDDEAGRYFLLAGAAGSPGAELAQAFLMRRRAHSLDAIWSTMPTAARRLGSDGLPEPAVAHFAQAGFERAAVAAFVEAQRQRHAKRSQQKLSEKSDLQATALPCLLLGFLILLLALGLAKLGEIVAWSFKL